MARLIGYARNIVGEDELKEQLRELEAAGCEPIFRDSITVCPPVERGGLGFALGMLEIGDTLAICHTAMLSDSMRERLEIVELIVRKGASLRTLRYPDEALDYVCELANLQIMKVH